MNGDKLKMSADDKINMMAHCISRMWSTNNPHTIAAYLYSRGYRNDLDALDHREIDIEALAEILCDKRGGHKGFPPAKWDYDLAQHLASNMHLWIVKRTEGEK